MASLKLINTEGADQGTVEASDRVFGADPNQTLVHTVAVAVAAAQRQGNHKTKNRNEVRGGGAKPFRQKGTGRARQGSIREPQMRGGGTVHVPILEGTGLGVYEQVRSGARVQVAVVHGDRQIQRFAVVRVAQGQSLVRPVPVAPDRHILTVTAEKRVPVGSPQRMMALVTGLVG